MPAKLFTDSFFQKYTNSDGYFDMVACLRDNTSTRERIICRDCNRRNIPILNYQKCPACNFSKSQKLDLGNHLLKMNDDVHNALKQQITDWVNIDDIPRPEIENRLGNLGLGSFLRANDLWRNASESRPKSIEALSCPINGCIQIRPNSSSGVKLRAHLNECNDEAHLKYKIENGWSQCPICDYWVRSGKGLLDHVSQYRDLDHQFFLNQTYNQRMIDEYTGVEDIDYVTCKVPGCQHRGVDLRQHIRSHHHMEVIDYHAAYGTKSYIEEIMNRGMRESTWGHHDVARDGHQTHSWGELFLDDWLFEHGIQHDPHLRIGHGCKAMDQAIYVDGITYYIEFDGMGRDVEGSRWTWDDKLQFYDIQVKNGIIGGYLIIRKSGIRDKNELKDKISSVMSDFISSQDKPKFCISTNREYTHV